MRRSLWILTKVTREDEYIRSVLVCDRNNLWGMSPMTAPLASVWMVLRRFSFIMALASFRFWRRRFRFPLKKSTTWTTDNMKENTVWDRTSSVVVYKVTHRRVPVCGTRPGPGWSCEERYAGCSSPRRRLEPRGCQSWNCWGAEPGRGSTAGDTEKDSEGETLSLEIQFVRQGSNVHQDSRLSFSLTSRFAELNCGCGVSVEKSSTVQAFFFQKWSSLVSTDGYLLTSPVSTETPGFLPRG